MVLNKFTKPAGLLFQTDHFLQFTCVPLQHAPEWMNTNNTQNACALPPPKKKKKKSGTGSVRSNVDAKLGTKIFYTLAVMTCYPHKVLATPST